MIFLSPVQLRDVDYLIKQSTSGIHHLFSQEDIKVAFDHACSIDEKEVDAIKKLFYEFISQKTLDAKKNFYKMLNSEQKMLVIRTYFNVVENELIESQPFLM